MIIGLYLFLTSLFFVPDDCHKMEMVRENYGNIQTEKQLNQFIGILDDVKCFDKGPYLASATMQKAQFAMAPWTKYNYFRKGKKMLEKFIEQNPENVEGKYIRFLIQTHAPFFLGYNKQIHTDAAFIRQNIELYPLTTKYKKQILDHLDLFENK